MPKRLPHALAVLLVSASSLAAQTTLSIDHSAVGCVLAEKFPHLEARVTPAEAVVKARVFFQTGSVPQWYAVAMKAEAGAFSGVLPKPKKSLKAYRYYLEVTDKALGTTRTPEYTTTVAAGPGGCQGKMMGSGLASAAVALEVPAGAPAIPAGFSASGVATAGTAGAAAATGAVVGAATGGGISTGVWIGVAGIAAVGAGAAVVVSASKGGSDARRTSYTGTFSKQWQRSNLTAVPGRQSNTCFFDNTLSGTLTITLDSPNGGGTGDAQITFAETEVGRTAGPLCNSSTPGPPPSGTYPVTGGAGHLTFSSGNNNQGAFMTTYVFTGALGSGVIVGQIAVTASGTSPAGGAATPGTLVTQGGSTEIPITLQ